MKKKLRLTDFFKSILILVVLCFSHFSYGQVTIAIQDFEDIPSTPIWSYAGTASIESTVNRFNGNESLRIGASNIITFSNIDVSGYSDITLSVAFASLGVDSGEDLFMDISYDNGISWTGTGSVKLVDGFSNASININTTNLSDPTTVSSNPYPTIIGSSETQVRVRFRVVGLDAGEYYFIDDVTLTGTLGTSPSVNTSSNALISFIYPVNSGPSTSQSFNLSGANLTGFPSDLTVSANGTNYEVSLDNSNFFSSVTVPYTSATLSNTPIYVRLKSDLAYGNYTNEEITITGGGDADGAVVTCSGSVTLAQCFSDNNNFEKFSVVTNTDGDVWSYSGGTYSMNGFNGGGNQTSNQWLILGDLDFSTYTNTDLIQLALNATEGFNGTDLKIFASSSYTGCPTDAGNFWLEIGTVSATGISQTFDLSVFYGENSVYVGIQYLDSDGTYSSWSLNDIKVLTSGDCFTINTPVVSYCAPPSVLSTTVTSLSGLNYVHQSGPSTSQSFNLSGINLTGFPDDITVNGSVNYEVSLDNSNFFSSVTVAYTSATLTDTPIYVRLQSGLAIGDYNNQNLTISGGGDTDGAVVSCSGSVSAPAPINDLCDNSTVLVVNSGATNGTLEGSTSTGTSSVKDVFYEFTPTVTGIYTILLNNLSISSDKDLYVFTTCPLDGDSDAYIYAGESNSNSQESITDVFTANNTYYIQLYDYDDIGGTFDIQVTASPALVVNTPSLTFGNQSVTTSSASQSFNLSGSFLTPASGNITITSPSTDFEVSLDDANWAPSVQIGYTTETLNTTPIYVRFSPQSGCATLAGDITLSGGGVVTPPIVSVTGNGVLTAPIANSATNLQDNSFEANWSTVDGATSYVIDVSTSSSFGETVPTSVTESFETGLTGGYQTATVTLSTGSWRITNVLSGTTGVNTGTRSAQLQSATGSALISPSFENGISSISFWATSSVTNGSIQVNYSIDGGVNWIPTLNSPYTNLNSTTTQIVADVNTNVPTLIQIRRTAGTIYIDDVVINSYINNPIFVSGYQDLNVGNVLTQTISGLASGTKYYYRVRALNGSCESVDSNVMEATTTGTVKWIGTTNTNWSTASNWSNALVPDGTYDIEIPSGNPVLNTAFTVQAGSDLTISGTGTLAIAPTASLTIAGTTNFGGNSVTLQSDVTGTATIGQVTGTLSNATNVTVERHIPAKRAWRLLTAPLKGTTNNTIANNWQGTSSEGVLLFSPSTYQSQAMTGYATGGNAPNIYQYGTGWQIIPNLSTESIFGANATDTKAYQVFVTGTHGSSNIASGSEATTLRPKGELITGNVTHSLTANTFKLIANPYASPLNTVDLVQNNSGSKAWLLDPTVGFGAYVTYDGSNWSITPSGSDMNIQSGQGFLVKSTGTTFEIQESHKTTGNSNTWFEKIASSTDDKIRVLLYKQINNEWQLADGILAVNSANGNTAVDNTDAGKVSNFNESMMFRNGTNNLSIEYRALPQINEVQPIRLTGTAVASYELRLFTENYNNSTLVPMLEDTQTGTFTTIPTDGSTVTVPFTGVVATGTNPDNRFKIVYQSALSNDMFNTLTVSVYPNPVNEGFLNINLLEAGKATYSLYNLLGQEVQKGTLATQNSQVTLSSLQTGIYILSIDQAGKKHTTKVVVE
jgi:hypothetical protein